MIANVGCLNAYHFGPFVVSEVWHLGALVDPGIPNDCGSRACFFHKNGSMLSRIEQSAGVGCIQVDSICLGGNLDGFSSRSLLFRLINLVDIVNRLQAFDGNVARTSLTAK